jgi:FAD:protein FMN transferase
VLGLRLRGLSGLLTGLTHHFFEHSRVLVGVDHHVNRFEHVRVGFGDELVAPRAVLTVDTGKERDLEFEFAFDHQLRVPGGQADPRHEFELAAKFSGGGVDGFDRAGHDFVSGLVCAELCTCERHCDVSVGESLAFACAFAAQVRALKIVQATPIESIASGKCWLEMGSGPHFAFVQSSHSLGHNRAVMRGLNTSILERIRQSTWAVWHINHFEAVLGTGLEVRVRASNRRRAVLAEAALLAEIDRLELIFSRFLPESELNRFLNSSEMRVSPELLEVLSLAELWRQRTRNAFHPGVDALSALWRLGSVPQAAQLEPILGQLDGPLWTISGENVHRTSGLPINFNAFAKGWIVDRACLVASQLEGVTDVLVNIGGDLRHVGSGEQRVAIADPFSSIDNAPALCEVHIQNRAVAGSGDSRRGFRIGTDWYSHVIDPRTGQPVKHTVAVSVIAPDAATADALATAFCVLEVEDSLQLADDLPDIACLIVTEDRQVRTNQRWHLFSASV